MKTISKRHTPALGVLASLLCLACSPSDQGTGGTVGPGIEKTRVGEINATIDGAPYRGETLVVPSEGTSTAEFMTIGAMTLITLQAHDPEADSMLNNVLAIEFSLTGDDVSAPVTGASASYYPQGMGEPFYMSEGEGEAEVVLEALSLEDGAASAAGRFTATLCRMADAFTEADPNDCVSVEGTFETALQQRG